ncbi:hypothetical protein [Fulvivirga lutea]|uniref:Uncharacterized protein n=1 Tax=Fulvivirga lutea TaxID=2810512 RepID=A0A974WFI9_9BACT|nr:hypothetical protein [Fulvivirga lutea]QSE97291.1 hypothetical protein JR347_17165 [Fulvivirga lutea]
MKNIFKYSLILFSLVFFASCEDEDTQRIPTDDLGTGPNVRIVLDQDFLFINLDDLSSAKSVFEIFSENPNDIAQVDISVSYTSQDGTVTTGSVVLETVTGAEIAAAGGNLTGLEITATEIVNGLAELTSLNDIGGGDLFTFTNTTTMVDGRVYPEATIGGNSNVTPNIVNSAGTTSFTSNWQLYVGCASPVEDIVGEYTSEIVDTNYGGFLGDRNEDVTITFKGPEPFRYEISDISSLAYVPFGGTAYPADIYDICGAPVMFPTNTFGGTTQVGPGSWDQENGVLTLPLFEAFNGLGWTVVLTKK